MLFLQHQIFICKFCALFSCKSILDWIRVLLWSAGRWRQMEGFPGTAVNSALSLALCNQSRDKSTSSLALIFNSLSPRELGVRWPFTFLFTLAWDGCSSGLTWVPQPLKLAFFIFTLLIKAFSFSVSGVRKRHIQESNWKERITLLFPKSGLLQPVRDISLSSKRTQKPASYQGLS